MKTAIFKFMAMQIFFLGFITPVAQAEDYMGELAQEGISCKLKTYNQNNSAREFSLGFFPRGEDAEKNNIIGFGSTLIEVPVLYKELPQNKHQVQISNLDINSDRLLENTSLILDIENPNMDLILLVEKDEVEFAHIHCQYSNLSQHLFGEEAEKVLGELNSHNKTQSLEEKETIKQ